MFQNPLVNKTILCGVTYIAPKGSNYSNIECFQVIEQDIMQFTSENDTEICWFRDFNARSASLNDIFIVDENICKKLDLDNNIFQTDEIYDKAISIPYRNSMDKEVNNYGLRLIELCKNSNLCILNGRGSSQSSQNFTCKDASVVDYFIISYSLFQNVIDFQILFMDLMLTDCHCPLSLQLRCFSYESWELGNKNDNFSEHSTDDVKHKVI